MPSLIMHMCVAKKIKEKLGIKEEDIFMLGSIAPDISKLVGLERSVSHFNDEVGEIILNNFLNKYDIKHPFFLGYYVHLYTDYLWEKYFLTEFINDKSIRKIDGTEVVNTKEMYAKLIYNDYTNLNYILVKEYNLSFEEFKIPDLYMEEIPIDKLNILIKKNKEIFDNSKENKPYTFDLNNAKRFIEESSKLIYSDIELLNRE